MKTYSISIEVRIVAENPQQAQERLFSLHDAIRNQKWAHLIYDDEMEEEDEDSTS